MIKHTTISPYLCKTRVFWQQNHWNVQYRSADTKKWHGFKLNVDVAKGTWLKSSLNCNMNSFKQNKCAFVQHAFHLKLNLKRLSNIAEECEFICLNSLKQNNFISNFNALMIILILYCSSGIVYCDQYI